jgi:hypothetical protein
MALVENEDENCNISPPADGEDLSSDEDANELNIRWTGEIVDGESGRRMRDASW